MALKEWKCLNCDKKFKSGDWVCVTGTNHLVESKRYYMNDAPTVPDASGHIDKRAGTLVLNIPPERRTTGPDGNERVIPGGAAQFVRGVYETDDPEKQFWLDQHKGMCSKEEWEAAYLNREEKLALKELELNAKMQRIEQQNNELLAQIQKRGA